MPFTISFHPDEGLNHKGSGVVATRDHATIIFDGYLHNRDAVAARSGAPADLSDAALALHSWATQPDRFPLDLTGEFALVAFDVRERTLLCARDHTGLRPFYWFYDGTAFHGSTDIESFFKLPTFVARPNEGYVAEWLAEEVTTRVETLYDGIHRLPPASTMRVDRNGPSTPKAYWSIDFDHPIRGRSDEECAAGFLDVWSQAVGCRCVRPAGVALSGGVDSTAVIGMAHHLGRAVGSYSLIFDEPEADERQHIDAVTTMLGTKSHAFAPAEYDAATFMRITRERRQPPPMPNGYMSADLTRGARDQGIEVLMTGVGGDDWFQGVSPALASADLLRQRRVTEVLSRSGAAGVVRGTRILLGHSLRSGWPAAARLVDRIRGVEDRVPPWISDALVKRVGLRERLARPAAKGRGLVASAMERHLTDGWQTFAIESEFAAAARAGIELTHPFFDRRVVEFSASLPEDQRFRGRATKLVVRNAMRGLIPELVRRRTTKARFDHLFPRALPRIDAPSMMRNMRLSDFGWVDEARLRAAYAEMQAAVAGGREYMHLAWPIWMAVSLEAWAEHNL